MTVETSDRKENFAGGQSALTFTFRADPNNPSDIKVTETVTATEVATQLTYGVDYTVSVNSDGVGGTVTVNPSYSTAYTQTVYRETTAIQESDYDDYNQFPADTLEGDIDKLMMIAQEIQEELERTLRYPISASGASVELPSPQASSFLRWNSSADALENADIPDPSTLVKASGAEASAGVEDTHYMTPAKTNTAIQSLVPFATQAQAEAGASTSVVMSPARVKQEVEKDGAVTLPLGNIPYKDEDDMTSNSASHVPTQQSVKAYVDNSIPTFGTLVTSYVKNTVYQASTDLWVIVTPAASLEQVTVYSDASNPPTTVLGAYNYGGIGGISASLCLPVKSGHYWKVTTSNSPTITVRAFG